MSLEQFKVIEASLDAESDEIEMNKLESGPQPDKALLGVVIGLACLSAFFIITTIIYCRRSKKTANFVEASNIVKSQESELLNTTP